MTMYRLCSVCGNKVPYGTKCSCEDKARADKYKLYKSKRDDIREQRFYSSKLWKNCRDTISSHQLGLDLIEWSKGNEDIKAERYHHIIEVKDDWSLRLDIGNIIGLTQQNHMKVHKLMEKSLKDKLKVQKYLKEILFKFEKEFY